MGGEGVERGFDCGVVAVVAGWGAEAAEPGGALGVVLEQAVDVGAGDQAVGGGGTVGAAVGAVQQGAGGVRAFGLAHVHFVAGEREAVVAVALHGFEPLSRLVRMVSTASRPRPGTWLGGPSTPSGSARVWPSIW